MVRLEQNLDVLGFGGSFDDCYRRIMVFLAEAWQEVFSQRMVDVFFLEYQVRFMQ